MRRISWLQVGKETWKALLAKHELKWFVAFLCCKAPRLVIVLPPISISHVNVVSRLRVTSVQYNRSYSLTNLVCAASIKSFRMAQWRRAVPACAVVLMLVRSMNFYSRKILLQAGRFCTLFCARSLRRIRGTPLARKRRSSCSWALCG